MSAGKLDEELNTVYLHVLPTLWYKAGWKPRLVDVSDVPVAWLKHIWYPPHLYDVRTEGFASNNSRNFPKPTIRHPEPFHEAISQLCGDEKLGRVWPFLSSSLFIFHTIMCLFMCTSRSSHLVPLHDGLLFTPPSSVGWWEQGHFCL